MAVEGMNGQPWVPMSVISVELGTAQRDSNCPTARIALLPTSWDGVWSLVLHLVAVVCKQPTLLGGPGTV